MMCLLLGQNSVNGKWGNNADVSRNILSSIGNKSELDPSQFATDIMWLFGSHVTVAN
jgi:hypothetical protein